MVEKVECVKTEFGYFELDSKVKVLCSEGFINQKGNIEYKNYSIEGYLTNMISDENITEICVSKTLNEPLDGMYMWIDMDFVVGIQKV